MSRREIVSQNNHIWFAVLIFVGFNIVFWVAVGIYSLVTSDASQPLLEGGAPTIMAFIFNLITNVLIVLAMLAMISFIGLLIFSGSSLQILIRILATVTGFLIYFGAKAVGLSIPSLMLSAISTTTPASIGVLGILLPGLAGMIVAWYCLKSIKKSEEVGLRLVILISTFIVVLFGDAYMASLGTAVTSQQGINVALLPNLTFTVGIALYIIFRYLPTDGNP